MSQREEKKSKSLFTQRWYWILLGVLFVIYLIGISLTNSVSNQNAELTKNVNLIQEEELSTNNK